MKEYYKKQGLFQALPERLLLRMGWPPNSGDGVHRWIFKAACILGREYSSELTFQIVRAALGDCGREVPDREIIDAIRNAGGKIVNSTSKSSVRDCKTKWPDRDAAMVSRLLKDAPSDLALFRAESVAMSGGEELTTASVINKLFPGEPFLCLGQSVVGMRTSPKCWWLRLDLNMQFIVPSPMTGTMGINQMGKHSHRCLNNTGARRFLVVEFDQNSIEEQSSLHRSLSKLKTLALLVHSGRRSLHGWYFVEGQSDALTRPFMDLAVRLGADPATWTRCQAVRLPGGRRENGAEQTVEFFNSNYKGGEK